MTLSPSPGRRPHRLRGTVTTTDTGPPGALPSFFVRLLRDAPTRRATAHALMGSRPSPHPCWAPRIPTVSSAAHATVPVLPEQQDRLKHLQLELLRLHMLDRRTVQLDEALALLALLAVGHGHRGFLSPEGLHALDRRHPVSLCGALSLPHSPRRAFCLSFRPSSPSLC